MQYTKTEQKITLSEKHDRTRVDMQMKTWDTSNHNEE